MSKNSGGLIVANVPLEKRQCKLNIKPPTPMIVPLVQPVTDRSLFHPWQYELVRQIRFPDCSTCLAYPAQTELVKTHNPNNAGTEDPKRLFYEMFQLQRHVSLR